MKLSKLLLRFEPPALGLECALEDGTSEVRHVELPARGQITLLVDLRCLSEELLAREPVLHARRKLLLKQLARLYAIELPTAAAFPTTQDEDLAAYEGVQDSDSIGSQASTAVPTRAPTALSNSTATSTPDIREALPLDFSFLASIGAAPPATPRGRRPRRPKARRGGCPSASSECAGVVSEDDTEEKESTAAASTQMSCSMSDASVHDQPDICMSSLAHRVNVSAHPFPSVEEEVERFLESNSALDRVSVATLRAESPFVQRCVLDRGNLNGVVNPSAVLMGRIRVAKASAGVDGTRSVGSGSDGRLATVSELAAEHIERPDMADAADKASAKPAEAISQRRESLGLARFCLDGALTAVAKSMELPLPTATGSTSTNAGNVAQAMVILATASVDGTLATLVEQNGRGLIPPSSEEPSLPMARSSIDAGEAILPSNRMLARYSLDGTLAAVAEKRQATGPRSEYDGVMGGLASSSSVGNVIEKSNVPVVEAVEAAPSLASAAATLTALTIGQAMRRLVDGSANCPNVSPISPTIFSSPSSPRRPVRARHFPSQAMMSEAEPSSPVEPGRARDVAEVGHGRTFCAASMAQNLRPFMCKPSVGGVMVPPPSARNARLGVRGPIRAHPLKTPTPTADVGSSGATQPPRPAASTGEVDEETPA